MGCPCKKKRLQAQNLKSAQTTPKPEDTKVKEEKKDEKENQ